jgi:hypothetical protein
MVDAAVGFDRIYQYTVFGVDVRGNLTSPAHSSPLRVSVKPIVDPPVNVEAEVVVSEGVPTGVTISWDGGTSDFSPNELIGDQDVLAATAVRSVFQVERRVVGGSVWDVMPATTESFFTDPVSSAPNPPFRPAYAVSLQEYDYRVIAMQSGGFISNYTDPVRVLISPEVKPPGTIWVRSTDTAISPTHVVVSWNYSGDFVDGWEVERAVVNKIYGSKITSMDSREALSLNYKSVASIKRESSRAHGLSSDTTGFDPRAFVGNRYYIDQEVSLANSYFYRVRAIDSRRSSDWVYAGIVLNDSPFDRKFMSALSDDERLSMSLDPRPIEWSGR